MKRVLAALVACLGFNVPVATVAVVTTATATAMVVVIDQPTPAQAVGGCTRLDGANYTSAHCTTPGGAPFYYARHFCQTDIFGNGHWQNGPHVSVGGYSPAGPCGGPISNRTIVQTFTP